MKKIFTLLFFVFTMSVHVFSQRCGSHLIYEKLSKDSNFVKEQNKIKNVASLRLSQTATNQTYYIPVVVHVVYNNTIQNISDTQILSQIDVLNKDYSMTNANFSNTPSAFVQLAGNAKIQFFLATKDPQGLPTTGITRTATTATQFGLDDKMKSSSTGGKDPWDTHKYLNIWVCNLTAALGYAYFPGGPKDNDGVTVNFECFGTTGVAKAPYNLGRTATHEIGHYLNLKHIWGDKSDCTGDDEIGDTPQHHNQNTTCQTYPYKVCSTTTADGEMFMNFMDYTPDTCMTMFSNGQIARMRTAIEASRTSFVAGMYGNDVGIVSLNGYSNNNLNCSDSLMASLVLKNFGNNTINNSKVKILRNNVPTDSVNWSGILMPGEQVTVDFPSTYIYGDGVSYKFTTGNPNSQLDSNLTNDTLQIVYKSAKNFQNLPIIENFEGTFPNSNWTIINPDDSLTWTKANVGTTNSTGSMTLQNFNYSNHNGQLDYYVSPLFNVQSKTKVTLDYAYQTYSASPTEADTLLILYSEDCGLTKKNLYVKGGADLTTAGASATSFVPTATQWQNISLDLSSLNGKQIRLYIANKTGFENNLYIDNIVIQDSLNQYVTIPDPNFKNYLINNTAINTDADTNISFVEAIAYAGRIIIYNLGIKSLTGIEAFLNIDTLAIDNEDSLSIIDLSKNINLVYLNISRTSLSTLDLSKNTMLKNISLIENELTSIDLGKNDSLTYFESGDKGSSAPALTYLNINNCKSLKGLVLRHDITNFDIRNLTKLDTLEVSPGGKQGHISSLDLSNKPNLKYLGIVGNPITVLDLSKNLNLEYLVCRANNLFSIDVSKNMLLKYFLASYNFQLTSIDVRNTKLPKDTNAVDFSNNPQLRTICIDNSQIQDTTIWLKDSTAHYSTSCAKLQQYVNIPDPRFKARLVGNTSINTDGDGEISFTEASSFTNQINVSNDSISSLVGIEAFVNLTQLICDSNQISILDLSSNLKLTELSCNFSRLVSIDVTKNTLLTRLRCSSNQLTSLDVSKNIGLFDLDCNTNQLISLDLSKNIVLGNIELAGNNLISLDVSKNTALKVLGCSYNQLTSLNLANNLVLYGLNCHNNQLVNLDVTKNLNLVALNCMQNQLISLNTSKNLNLEWLFCKDNLLKSLNLTKNTRISNLDASNNQIAYLNVAYNPEITYLNVENNNLTNLYLVQNPSLGAFNGQYNPQLSFICASPTQNTSAWVKDSATVINTTCTRANDNKLFADNYHLDKNDKDVLLNVLLNDNAVSLQTLYIDLMPDSAGIQQELTTAKGTFTVKNQTQLYFTPSDTVGDISINYMLIDSAGIITSNTATIDVSVNSKLKFYDGISPNGDGKNDKFHITYVRPNSLVKLNVYDMNGFVVYTNNNYDNKWEGLDNDGKKLANGTYYYIVQYQESNTSDVVQYNGFVEIRN